MKRLILSALCLAVALSLWGCNTEITADTSDETTTRKTIHIDHSPVYAITDYPVPAFARAEGLSYVADSELAGLQDLLIKELSKTSLDTSPVEFETGENGENIAISKNPCHGVGLFDINFDGVPELARWYNNGGSAGNSTIEFYDLSTGDQVGTVGTGGYTSDNGKYLSYGDWAIYVDKDGAPAIFGNYEYSSTDEEGYFAELQFSSDLGRWVSNVTYSWLRRVERISEFENGVRVNVTVDNGYYFWKGTSTAATAEEVKAYFASLEENFCRVDKSELVIVKWEEIDGYEALPDSEIFKKMADRLLQGTDQKFVKLNQDSST